MTISIKDITGKQIKENDILQDKVPSKGIVKVHEGKILVTSNYEGRDIRSVEEADLLDQDLVNDNNMIIIGNTKDNPELL